MCTFFSAISDGLGNVRFFTPEDIVGQMAIGNPKSYNWNSHTSIAHFNGLLPKQEDMWNKWEYNVSTKKLRQDSLVAIDDSKKVKRVIVAYLKDKDIGWLQNIYNRNSGDRNSGYRNPGDYNSGNRNSGDYNSGIQNSGNRNSGDRNSGYYNSGYYNSGWFNTDEPKMRIFNTDLDITVSEFYQKNNLPSINCNIIKFVTENKMTTTEKKKYPNYKTIGGYLKVLDYKVAWKKFWKETTQESRKLFLNLPNFDAKIFKEITGIAIKEQK